MELDYSGDDKNDRSLELIAQQLAVHNNSTNCESLSGTVVITISQISSYLQQLPNLDLKSKSIDIVGKYNTFLPSFSTPSQVCAELLVINDDIPTCLLTEETVQYDYAVDYVNDTNVSKSELVPSTIHTDNIVRSNITVTPGDLDNNVMIHVVDELVLPSKK